MEKQLTKETLLELGFKEEHVPTEESGDKPFTYYTYTVLDAFEREKCVLITDADTDNDGNFYVEFFNSPEIGVFEDYDVVKDLIRILNIPAKKNSF